MTSIKDKLLDSRKGDRAFELDPSEFALARDLNNALNLNVYRQQVVSGYLTILTRHHLPDWQVRKGYTVEYALDLSDNSDKVITITEVPLSGE